MKKTVLSVSTLTLIVALAGAGWAQDATAPTVNPMAGSMGGFDFAAVDANSDGKITKEEVEAFKTARLTAMDSDGDGKLSAAELTVAHETARAARKAARTEAMVKQFDKDGDGMLSFAEMPAGTGMDKMFSRLDSDNDGAISQAELDAAKAKMAGRRDGKKGGNRDGKGHGGKGHGGKGHDGGRMHDGGFWGMFDGTPETKPAN